jgi:hypothetical protein
LLGEVPLRSYVIVASACKKANLSLLMMKVYEFIKNMNINDKTLYKIIMYTLARSVAYSNVALEMFEDMDKKGVEKPDLYMYYAALVACDSGRDWKLAVSLLDRMISNGHPLSTVR